MKIVCISDTHKCTTKEFAKEIPLGDTLIHCGDAMSAGSLNEIDRVVDFFSALPHKNKIFCFGNHEICFDDEIELGTVARRRCNRYIRGMFPRENEPLSDLFTHRYFATFEKDFLDSNRIALAINELNNNGVITTIGDFEIDGIKFYTYPYMHNTPAWGFYRSKKFRKDILNSVPTGSVDVFISHAHPSNFPHLEDHAGSNLLTKAITRIKPKYHLFGHCHTFGGMRFTKGETDFINAAFLDREYIVPNDAKLKEYWDTTIFEI